MAQDTDTPNWRREFDRFDGAYAPATLRAYLSDNATFEAWCLSEGRVAYPADADTLCAYLEAHGALKAQSSLRRQLCAIRKAHSLLDIPDATRHENVSLAMRRIRRMTFERARQAKGLTRDYLERFLDVQPDTPTGLRNRAMLSLGYDLLTRRSELVALRLDDVTFLRNGTVQVLIRRSKTDPYGQGRVTYGSTRSADLLRAWLAYRGTEIAPLFCPIYRGHVINRYLSTTTVVRLIKTTARKAGLPAEDVAGFSGHSMRVGAAQDLLRAGRDTAAIMRAGGWKSIEILSRYLEKAELNVWAA